MRNRWYTGSDTFGNQVIFYGVYLWFLSAVAIWAAHCPPLQRKTLPGCDILLADHDNARAEALAGELGACSGSNETAAAESHFLFLGVKPQMMEDLLTSIAPVLSARTDLSVLVTMAAGMTIARIQELAGGAIPLFALCPTPWSPWDQA